MRPSSNKNLFFVVGFLLFLSLPVLFFFNQVNSLTVKTLGAQAGGTKHGTSIVQEKKVLSASTLLAQALPTATSMPTPTSIPPTPTPTPMLFGISGTVYNDYNRNQVKDGTDVFAKGVTVKLSGATTATTTTDANGNYIFPNLLIGTYTITVILPSGYAATTATSKTYSTLVFNQVLNFGIIPLYTISGNVFDDTNTNGSQGGNELGFPGATVALSGATSATTTTDSNGNYTFSNIYGGNNYTVALQMPSSYRSTNANSLNISLNANQVINFGITSLSIATVGDICSGTTLDVMIVFDRSGSMTQQDPATGNTKLSEAKRASDTFIDIVAANLPTARIGVVQFSDSASVLIPLTSDFASVKSAISGISASGNTCHECGVSVANQELNANTRSNTQKLVIVMTDGIANATISSNGNTVSSSTAENAAMSKVIDGVNGQNILYDTIGVGVSQGSSWGGSWGGSSDQINEPFLTQIATTNSGHYYNDPTVGDLTKIYTDLASTIIPTGKITGTVFNDTNFNQILDSGESPLSGWNIRLSQGVPTPRTVVTDSSGNYAFMGLCTNPYTLTEIVEPGWIATTTNPLSISVINGNTYNTGNFGNKQYFSVSGDVYIDTNKNGIKDSGESNYTSPISITSTQGTVTTNAGSYKVGNLLSNPSIGISYTSLPPDYVMTYPLNGPPPSLLAGVGSSCNTYGASGASCSGGDIINMSFGISNLYPWYQSTCGNIRIDSGISDRIYAGNSALVTNATCTTPGIAFSGNASYSFGKGQISSTNRIVGGTIYPESYNSSSPIASSYTSLSSKTAQAAITPTGLTSICNISSCTLPSNLAHGVYTSNGDVVLNAYTFPANQNYVFLINGNLTINGSITIPQGSSAVFAVSGNIIVNPSVGVIASSASPSVEGIYTTDKSFIVKSAGNCNDLRLNIAGAVITNAALGGGIFQNDRDLCGGDSSYPTISFIQRLDFLFSLPTFIRTRNSYSWEAAP